MLVNHGTYIKGNQYRLSEGQEKTWIINGIAEQVIETAVKKTYRTTARRLKDGNVRNANTIDK